jgi:hypothetical protein
LRALSRRLYIKGIPDGIGKESSDRCVCICTSSFHLRPKRVCEQLELIVVEPAGVNVQSFGVEEVAAPVDRLMNG